jgi:hypothetical protein
MYTAQADKNKGTALVDLFYWLVNDGQQFAQNLHYAKLPTSVVQKDIQTLRQVKYNSDPLLKVSS